MSSPAAVLINDKSTKLLTVSFMRFLCSARASHLAFLWPYQHMMRVEFAKEAIMAAITFNAVCRRMQWRAL